MLSYSTRYVLSACLSLSHCCAHHGRVVLEPDEKRNVSIPAIIFESSRCDDPKGSRLV